MVALTQRQPSLRPAPRVHLYQIDVVRVVTFAAVIASHVISGVTNPANPDASQFTVALHWTRTAFFFLTALVLVHGFARKPVRVFPFWRKRILAVGLPYLVWSAIYTWFCSPQLDWAGFWNLYLQNLINGGAMYHLYFLVVSIQFYLLFPAFLALQRAMRNHPWILLAAAAVLQAGINAAETYLPPPPPGLLGYLWANDGTLLPSYLFYLVLGGVAAMHLDTFTAWVRRNTALIVATAAGTLVLLEMLFWSQVDSGMSALDAGSPLRPTLIPWCTAAILLVYAIGAGWAVHRKPGGLAERFFLRGTDRSFGIFLSHPLVLGLVTSRLWPLLPLPPGISPVWMTALTFAATVLGSVVLTEVLRRTPVSKLLTGRS